MLRLGAGGLEMLLVGETATPRAVGWRLMPPGPLKLTWLLLMIVLCTTTSRST